MGTFNGFRYDIQRLGSQFGLLNTFGGLLLALVHNGYGFFCPFLQDFDHGINFLRRLLRSAGQCAYFVCYHCKAPALFTGTSCLNCRIQCQQVGLIGDTTDNIQDATNAGAVLMKLMNNLRGIFNVAGQYFNGGFVLQ